MKQMRVDDGTPFLPEEIIANILKRIPFTSLVSFQLVCKQWKNLLETPSFIADHVHHRRHDNPSLLLQSNHGADSLKLCLIDDKKQVREFQNPPLIDSLKCANIIGSSYGLLCVEFDEFGMSPPSLLLWNPLKKEEVRQIPRTTNDFKGECILGFGFSPIVNDYKIVRAYKFGLTVKRVEVYSLNKGSWKEIEFGNLEGVTLFDQTVTVNGAMFWNGNKNVDLIVSFDIAKEVFRLIPMPDLNSASRAVLTVYESKLAMFYNVPYQSWVMEEGTGASKERWSWTKKYIISSPYFLGNGWRDDIVYNFNIEIMPRLRRLIGFEVENEEPIFVIFAPKVNTNEFAICKCGHGRHVFNHAESLVRVGNTTVKEDASQNLNY